MPFLHIFAFAMMLTLTIVLAVAALLCEFVLHRSVGRFARSRRVAYYAVSGVALSLWYVLMIIGRLTDYTAVWFAFASDAAFLLFMLNAIFKIIFGAAVLLTGKSAKRGWFRAARIACTVLTLTLAYGLCWERNRLRTEELELAFERLPAAADGLRVVQVADIHIGLTLNRYRLLRQTVERVNSLRPDVIVFCGDIINARPTELDSTAMAILGRMRAPSGIYSVIGNHDNGMYITDTIKIPREECKRLIIEKEQAMGWTVLVDQSTDIVFGGDTITVTGLDYPAELRKGSHGRGLHETDYSAIYAPIAASRFNITIAHYPSVWDKVLECGRADLTLAGHVHAMQLKIPVGHRGWSPAALVYKYWSGLYGDGGHYLNVSDGAGSGIPVRVGVPPEISIITLRRQ